MRAFERIPGPVLVALALALAPACGEDDAGDGTGSGAGTGNGTPDGGADLDGGEGRDGGEGTDGGSGMDGGSGRDAGDAGDTGGPSACNPVDGTGCPGSERCVLSVEGGGTSTDQACREAEGALAGLEAECDAATQNCEAGLVCVGFQGEAGPTCRQVCSAGGSECDVVEGASTDYTCNEFGDEFGVCLGFEPCAPQSPGDCAGDETCSVIDGETSATGCTPAGNAGEGMACGGGTACQSGLICLDLGGGAVCFQPCDEFTPCDDPEGQRCTGLQDLDFGVCQERPETCDPVDPQSCPAGQTCSLIDNDGNTGCTTAGSSEVGESCAEEACVRGAICINIGGQGAQCWQACDADNPCGDGGMCSGLDGIEFGVCGL